MLLWAWPRNFQTFTKLPFKYLDYGGTVLTMGSTVLLVFIMNQSAVREYEWDSAPAITILVISGLCWAALIFWQRCIYRHPKLQQIRSQFPYRILSNRVMMCYILYGFLSFASLSITLRPRGSTLAPERTSISAGTLGHG